MNAQQFWAAVDRSGGSDACWPWRRAIGGDGYGRVRFLGHCCRSHRVAFFLSHGLWPEVARHSCDVPLCCNPAHLVDGSTRDNVHDCIDRGRHVAPPRWVGDAHPRAKLTAADAAEIRRRIGGESALVLAREYGIGRSTIGHVLAGRTWVAT